VRRGAVERRKAEVVERLQNVGGAKLVRQPDGGHVEAGGERVGVGERLECAARLPQHTHPVVLPAVPVVPEVGTAHVGADGPRAVVEHHRRDVRQRLLPERLHVPFREFRHRPLQLRIEGGADLGQRP